MISIQKKFLFVHVPKTGGNSIQSILKDYSEDQLTALKKGQDGIERFGLRSEKYDIHKHSTLSQYKSVIEPEIYGTLFKFAAIRNPWDKMISAYFSPYRNVTEWNRAAFLKLVRKSPLLRYHITELSPFDRFLMKHRIPVRISWKKLDADIDFLIRFESIDQDFKLVCEKLDIPYSPLPQRNQSTRKHYSCYYDQELIEIVGAKFAEEVSYGHYEFERA